MIPLRDALNLLHELEFFQTSPQASQVINYIVFKIYFYSRSYVTPDFRSVDIQ